MEDKIIEYILVNKELGMSTGKIAGQVAHAQTLIDAKISSIMVSVNNSEEEKQMYKNYVSWINHHYYTKIILKAKEKDLLKAIELGAIPVRDNGLTEIPKGSLTVVGFVPQPKSNLTKFTKRLQLL